MKVLSLILAMALVFSVATYVAADDDVVAEWIPVQGEGFVPAHLVLNGK